jgi:hypothetical protein
MRLARLHHMPLAKLSEQFRAGLERRWQEKMTLDSGAIHAFPSQAA